jgi:threonine dehydrogenase-like Zn-dependent dehydrogenase
MAGSQDARGRGAASARVGMFAPFDLLERGPEAARAFLAQAGEAGIGHVCCGDHVSFAGAGFDGLVQATALAMLHPTLPIYSGVYLLPLRHPVLVARQLMGHLGATAVVEQLSGDFNVIVDGVGGATFGLAIEHVGPRGVVVNIATRQDDETVSFQAKRFDRARGATIYTLNLPDELASHASAASDLARLCALAADGRLDGQVELECSWRQPDLAIDALLDRRIGGKAVLHID